MGPLQVVARLALRHRNTLVARTNTKRERAAAEVISMKRPLLDWYQGASFDSTVMLMVRFLLSDSTEGCSAMHVYCPSSIALIFLSVSVEEGRIQSSP